MRFQSRVVFSVDKRTNGQPLVFKWKQSVSEMDDLAAFAVLIEAGSFTLAAQQLGCSKGQLSKRISLLERVFPWSCCTHHAATELTAAGAALLPQPSTCSPGGTCASGIGATKDGHGWPGGMTVPVSLGETFFVVCWLEFSQNTRGADRAGAE